MKRTRTLPEFAKPPVNEVVQAVNFIPLGLQIIHVGMFYERISADYPEVQTHPLLPPTFEQIGPSGARPPPQMSFNFLGLQRTWFVAKDKLTLMQLQPDRFVYNWRSLNQTDEYRRYDYIRRAFGSGFNELTDFCVSKSLAPPAVTVCELSYINHITPPPGASMADISRIFRGISQMPQELSGSLEDCTFGFRRLLSRAGAAPSARLYVQITPFVKQDSTLAYNLELTVRGYPQTNDFEAVVDFNDFAHETIVSSFAVVTTPEMHDLWERSQ